MMFFLAAVSASAAVLCISVIFIYFLAETKNVTDS